MGCCGPSTCFTWNDNPKSKDACMCGTCVLSVVLLQLWLCYVTLRYVCWESVELLSCWVVELYSSPIISNRWIAFCVVDCVVCVVWHSFLLSGHYRWYIYISYMSYTIYYIYYMIFRVWIFEWDVGLMYRTTFYLFGCNLILGHPGWLFLCDYWSDDVWFIHRTGWILYQRK